MSVDLASAVASAGESSPALDSPSVSSSSTRDLMRILPSRFARSDASLSLSTPSATASPIAVPISPCCVGKSIWSSASIATSWSSVSGTRLSAFPAKQTTPMRSFGRPANPSPPRTKRVPTSLSASRRLVCLPSLAKSSARIESLRSTTISMATPSTRVRAVSLGITGRAIAITMHAIAAARIAGSSGSSRTMRPRGECATASSELNRTASRERRQWRRYGSAASGSSRSSQIDDGWNIIGRPPSAAAPSAALRSAASPSGASTRRIRGLQRGSGRTRRAKARPWRT